MDERALAQAKGMDVRISPHRRTEPCVCGGQITAEVGWEAAAIDEHNRSAQHAAWRAWRELRQ